MNQYWHVFINQIHPIWAECVFPTVTVFENWAFMEITKVKWCHTDRALIRLVSALQEEERPELSCSLGTCAKERPFENISKSTFNRRSEPGGNVSTDRSERCFEDGGKGATSGGNVASTWKPRKAKEWILWETAGGNTGPLTPDF